MSWRKTIQTIPESKSGSWKDTIKNDVSELESGLRGAAQGVSLGFSDELTGGLEALKDVALTDKQLSDLEDLYIQHRDESRKANKLAQEANPGSYTTGEIAGSVGTAFIPGMNVGKIASLGGRVAANAGLGALAATGLSDADNASEVAKDALKGGALAGATSYGLEKIAPYMKKGAEFLGDKLADGSDYLTKKAGKGLFGVDEKATENYLKNSADVNKAYSIGELADSVLNKSDETSAINEMRKKASDLSSKAWETLDNQRGIPKNDILQALDNAQNGLLVDGNIIGKAQEKAYNSLNDLSSQIAGLNDNVSEPTLKSIIQNLDSNINWNNPEMGPTNDAIKNIRTYIDQRLKLQNPMYENAMKKVEDTTKATEQVKSVFQNRLNPENYDKFNKSVKNLINKDNMSAANQAVDKIQEHTGYDLRKDIVDSWTKSQFEKGDVNGSRKTVLGGMIGTAAGTVVGNPMMGGAIGSSAGFTVDRYAGPIFKSLLNGKIKAEQAAPYLGKYAKPIIDAASKGNSSLASTIFVLQQTDPEFRKMMNNDSGKKD